MKIFKSILENLKNINIPWVPRNYMNYHNDSRKSKYPKWINNCGRNWVKNESYVDFKVRFLKYFSKFKLIPLLLNLSYN